MLLQVISVIDGFSLVGVGGGAGGGREFFLFEGKLKVVLLECSFVREESDTLLTLVFGSFYWPVHRLLDALHLLISR